MKKNNKKTIFGMVAILICVTLIVTCIISVKNGFELSGIPNVEDVEKISLINSKLPEEERTLEDREQIEIIVNLTGLLNYSIFDNINETEAADIIIKYYLKNGKCVCVSVNKNMVWLNDKKYALKEKGKFVTVIEGIFYPEIAY